MFKINNEKSCKWNKIKKRLQDIVDPNLNIKFVYAPVQRRTGRSEYLLKYFYVELNDEIIWSYPYNSKTPDYEVLGVLDFDHPIKSIMKYLDESQDKLLQFKNEDKIGIAEILNACDKRIGFEKLKKRLMSVPAQLIFNSRFSDKIRKNQKGNTNNKYTFENFYSDDSNAKALYMCKKELNNISDDKLRKNLSHIYLKGDMGVGKTHLLNAIKNYYSSKYLCIGYRYSNLEIISLSASEFMKRFYNFSKNEFTFNGLLEIKKTNIFLIDELDYFVGKNLLYENFINLINSFENDLLQLRKPIQLVFMAGRKTPTEILKINKQNCHGFSDLKVVKIDQQTEKFKINAIKKFVKEKQIKIPLEKIKDLVKMNKNLGELFDFVLDNNKPKELFSI